MQFKIPQDVQRADKIVGPLTLRQLIIVAIGSGIDYSLYLVLSKQYMVQIWLIPVIFIMLITLVFAFYRFQNLPFEKVLFLFIEYKFKPRKRTFEKMKGDVFISSLQPILIKKSKASMEGTKTIAEHERLKKIQELTQMVDTSKKPSSKS